MGEKLTLKPITNSDWSYGFDVGGYGDFGVGTLVTDKSTGGGANASFLFSDKEDTTFLLKFSYLGKNEKGKICTDPDAPGCGYKRESNNFHLGFARRKKPLIFELGDPGRKGSLVTESYPFFGVGKAKIPAFKRSIEGVEGSESLPGYETNYFEVGTRSAFGLQLRPAKNNPFQMTIMPDLCVSYRFAGDGKYKREFSRLNIAIGVNVYLGYGTMPSDTSKRLSLGDYTFAGYNKILRIINSLIAEKVLYGPNDAVQGSGWLDEDKNTNKNETKEPSPTEQIKMYSAIAAFVATGDNSNEYMHASNEIDHLNFLYVLLEGASGLTLLIAGQTEGTKATGTGDLSRMGGMLLYKAWGLDKESKRNAKGDDLDKYMAYAYSTLLAKDMALFFIGLAIGNNEAGRVVTGAGVSSAMSLASNPAPGTNVATKKIYAYAPVIGHGGTKKGQSGGAVVDVTWNKLDYLYGQYRVTTHGIAPKNLGNRFTKDEQFKNTELPSSASATFGAQYYLEYPKKPSKVSVLFKVGTGLDMVNYYGEEEYAGIGASANSFLGIKIKSFSIGIGGYMAAHKYIGAKGFNFEGAPLPFIGIDSN